MLTSPFGNDQVQQLSVTPPLTWTQSANNFLSTIWTQTSPLNDSLDNLNSCSTAILREKSIALNVLIGNADSTLEEVRQELSRAESKTRDAKAIAMNKHSFAYEKLKDLDQKKNNLKYKIFTDLDLNTEQNFLFGDVFYLEPQTNEFDQPDYLTTIPSTEENVIKIDRKIKQYIELVNKLALKKLSMQLEITDQSIQQQFNFQIESDMMSHAFDRRKDLYAKIHNSLINTSQNIQEFNAPLLSADIQSTDVREEKGSFGDYLKPIFSFISGSTIKTGFESQPNNIFHLLCSSYLIASEEADKAFEKYKIQCKEAFEIFSLFEKAQASATSLKERKCQIQDIINHKAQYLLTTNP